MSGRKGKKANFEVAATLLGGDDDPDDQGVGHTETKLYRAGKIKSVVEK